MNRDISREGNSFNKYGSYWSQRFEFLLNCDSVLHKIAYILCNRHCYLNKNGNIAFE